MINKNVKDTKATCDSSKSTERIYRIFAKFKFHLRTKNHLVRHLAKNEFIHVKNQAFHLFQQLCYCYHGSGVFIRPYTVLMENDLFLLSVKSRLSNLFSQAFDAKGLINTLLMMF